MAKSLVPPKNGCKRSINNVWSCVLVDQQAMQWCEPIIELSAACMGDNGKDNIASTSYKWAPLESRWFLVLYLSDQRAMQWHSHKMEPSAAFMGKTASDDITTISKRYVLTERQPLLLGLSKLHSNELHCNDPKWSYQWSVFFICPCIELHKYACNVSQIWYISCMWL